MLIGIRETIDHFDLGLCLLKNSGTRENEPKTSENVDLHEAPEEQRN